MNYGALLHSSMWTTDNITLYHAGLQTKKLGQTPILLPNSYAGVIISAMSRDFVGYRIEIVYIQYTINHPTTIEFLKF